MNNEKFDEKEKIKVGIVDFVLCTGIVLGIVLFICMGAVAQASTLIQSDKSTVATSTTSGTQQQLGHSLSGQIYDLSMYMSSVSTSTYYRRIYECYLDAYIAKNLNLCNFYYPTTSGTTEKFATVSTFAASSTISFSTSAFYSSTSNTYNAVVGYPTLDPDKWYILYDYIQAGAAELVYGSNTDNYTNGSCINSTVVSTSNCRGLADVYFVINTIYNPSDVDNTTTRIINAVSPINGQTTPSNNVVFEFNYYYNSTTGGYQQSGIILNNLTTQQSVLVANQDILASGVSTYSQAVVLTSGNFYSWTPCLISTTSNTRLCSGIYTFSVLVNSEMSVLPDNYQEGTSTETISNFPLHIYNLFPFNTIVWLGSFINSYGTVSTSSTSTVMVFKEQSNGNPMILSTTTPIDYSNSVGHPIFGFLRTMLGIAISITVISGAIMGLTRLL